MILFRKASHFQVKITYIAQEILVERICQKEKPQSFQRAPLEQASSAGYIGSQGRLTLFPRLRANNGNCLKFPLRSLQ